VQQAVAARNMQEALTASNLALLRQKHSIPLPVSVQQPAFTTADAQALHITDKIASYRTVYYSSNARIHNIHLAGSLLNNSVTQPGATWSFNAIAGEATTAKGYQVGHATTADGLVDSIGGGICQVATTVFNAVYTSGLPIAERNNHSLYIASYPAGRDAAISYPSKDLKWVNDTSSPILLTVTYTNTSITATLWGKNPHYKVVTSTSPWQKGEKFDVTKVKDPTMAKGKTQVETAGVNGRKIEVTRKVYNAAGVLLRDTTFHSTYLPIDEVVNVGTKKTTATTKGKTADKDAAATSTPATTKTINQ
jgi:vancomycin resistance protein YoaR